MRGVVRIRSAYPDAPPMFWTVSPIGSYDFTPTPDKSVSVAWAFAPPVEQAQIYNAHLEAAREAVATIATEVGYARLGKGGEEGREAGHVGWVEFTHHTSRRTVAVIQDGVVESTPGERAPSGVGGRRPRQLAKARCLLGGHRERALLDAGQTAPSALA
jgi:TrwC relaxase